MKDLPELWWELPIAAIDVETTGLSADSDKIIEIAVVHMRAGQVEDRYCQLVQPGIPVGPDSQRITGISDADLEGAPVFADIAEEVERRLTGRAILAYNLAFDRGFVAKALRAHGRSWPADSPELDPLVLARGVFPEQRGFKLGMITERLGIPLEEAHRADHDAEAAGRVLYAMRDLLPARTEELLELQSAWVVEQAQATSGWRRPREADAHLVLGDAPGGDGLFRLGPSYRYGQDADLDPLRFVFRRLRTGARS